MPNRFFKTDTKKILSRFLLLWIFTGLVFLPQPLLKAEQASAQDEIKAQSPANPSAEETDDYEDEYEDEAEKTEIWDPLQKINRKIFTFNDKMYFWVIDPVSRGYARILPSPVRISIKNFFNNVKCCLSVF